MEGEKAQLAKARQAAEPATPAPAKTLPAKATPVKAVREPPPVHYLTLIPAEQAVTTLKAFWPQLFEETIRICWRRGYGRRCLRTLRRRIYRCRINRCCPV